MFWSTGAAFAHSITDVLPCFILLLIGCCFPRHSGDIIKDCVHWNLSQEAVWVPSHRLVSIHSKKQFYHIIPADVVIPRSSQLPLYRSAYSPVHVIKLPPRCAKILPSHSLDIATWRKHRYKMFVMKEMQQSSVRCRCRPGTALALGLNSVTEQHGDTHAQSALSHSPPRSPHEAQSSCHYSTAPLSWIICSVHWILFSDLVRKDVTTLHRLQSQVNSGHSCFSSPEHFTVLFVHLFLFCLFSTEKLLASEL